MTTDAIQTQGLTKRFGEFVAVDALDLLVPVGTVARRLASVGGGTARGW